MPIELPFRIVDVFTDKPLAGNALCVVDGEPGDGADLMQRFAREMNLSETTFVTPTGEHAYRVRIFTPTAELPFAGHPTLGTAWTLGPGTWTQHSTGTSVDVVVTHAGASMTQPDPTFTEVYPEELSDALGIKSTRAFAVEVGGLRHLVAATNDDLKSVRMNAGLLQRAARSMNVTGVGAFRVIDDSTLHVRLFVPTETMTFEDPGTGSAAGPIGVLARDLFGVSADLQIRQGDEVGRPCRIDVHAERGAIRVGGAVAATAQGKLTLP